MTAPNEMPRLPVSSQFDREVLKLAKGACVEVLEDPLSTEAERRLAQGLEALADVVERRLDREDDARAER